MAKPSGWKGHHVSRLSWKQKHHTKVSLQAAQDNSDHGSSSQQPSGCVARDEPIDLTESNNTQREPSSTDAITSHASRKRKTDEEGQLLVEPRSVELRKDLVERSRIANVSLQPYGGAHQPQNSLNDPRSTQRSTHQATYGKTPSLSFKHVFGDNVTSKQEDSHQFPDDDRFAKKRKIQTSNPHPDEVVELDDNEHSPVTVTSQERLPQRNFQVSSTSKRNDNFIGPQTSFRSVETRMKPNSKRTKPGPNAFHTDSGQVSPYFSDRQPL